MISAIFNYFYIVCFLLNRLAGGGIISYQLSSYQNLDNFLMSKANELKFFLAIVSIKNGSEDRI